MATHIMLSVAVKEDDLVSSSYLAESLNTNPVVVRRILSELQKAGLLETHAGRTGGAKLARKASSITMDEVYEAVDDGALFAFNPNEPNKTCSISCEMKSVLEPLFTAASKSLTAELKKVKLSDAADRLRKKCSGK